MAIRRIRMARSRSYMAKVTIWRNGKILISPHEESKRVSHIVIDPCPTVQEMMKKQRKGKGL